LLDLLLPLPLGAAAVHGHEHETVLLRRGQHELVALAVCGQQVLGVLGVPLDLVAQPQHHRVQRPGHHRARVPPHLRVQDVAVHRRAAAVSQVGNQLGLFGRERLGAPVLARDPEAAQVDSAGVQVQVVHRHILEHSHPGLGIPGWGN
jgi:hypothetical protein